MEILRRIINDLIFDYDFNNQSRFSFNELKTNVNDLRLCNITLVLYFKLLFILQKITEKNK